MHNFVGVDHAKNDFALHGIGQQLHPGEPREYLVHCYELPDTLDDDLKPRVRAELIEQGAMVNRCCTSGSTDTKIGACAEAGYRKPSTATAYIPNDPTPLTPAILNSLPSATLLGTLRSC
jgi:hypothetical protein